MTTRKSAKSILRWIGRRLLIVFLLFLGLIIFLLIREAITRSKYRAEYPPPGQMVSLGTHDLHLNCVGSGQPTFVFEADLDTYGSLSWAAVQTEVGKFTRACTYDRAGFMWSEPGPHPRDGVTIAAELAAALDAAGEDGPYLMVAHAFGGAYVRIFAGQHPDDVCGMILVDSSHPDQTARMAAVGIEQEIPPSQLRPLITFLTYLGIPGRYKGPQYSLPQEIYDAQQAFLPKSSLAWFEESSEALNTLAQSGEVTTLDDIPLIVLASARPGPTINGQDPQEARLELQQELTLLSENSEIRRYEDLGHYLHHDSPEVVIAAIQDVMAQCDSP